jgi:hypothetical protein
MRRISMLAGALAVAAMALTACGSASGGDSGGSGGEEMVTITSPQDGATVQPTFMLEWDSTVPLGPPDSGKDHVHVYVDGQQNDYTVVGGTQFQIENLSPGQHEVDISLQHADHSPVGPKSSIHVTVSGSGSGSGSDTSPSTGSGGGGYGY